jgi:hypothetical protein
VGSLRLSLASASYEVMLSRFPLKLLIWEIWSSSKVSEVSLQVTVWLGSLITDYGQETRNCAARQQISHRTFTNEGGVECVEVRYVHFFHCAEGSFPKALLKFFSHYFGSLRKAKPLSATGSSSIFNSWDFSPAPVLCVPLI